MNAVRETSQRQQAEASGARVELATVTAQLAAAREQTEREITHAAERVADQRQHTETLERETERLRAELDAQRTSHADQLEQLRRQLIDAQKAQSHRSGSGREGTP
jgi:hypothetical protein